MTRGNEVRDVAASVHQRLLNLARDRAADFNLLLQRFVAERFLYRLSVSVEVDSFTLKGATLFLVWTGREFRPTRDVDLLRRGSSDHAAVRGAIESICAVAYPGDAISFDATSIRVEDIRGAQEYGGVRVNLRARVGSADLPLRVDLGFGDAVTPDRIEADFPTLLDFPAPRLWTYPRETSIAEKFDAMVRLGLANTRMKDFWDVAALAEHFSFEGETLRAAIADTFARRRTPHTREMPEALRPAFYVERNRVALWEAFQTRGGGGVDGPSRFDEAGERVRALLGPVRDSLVQNEPFTKVWPRGGPWGTGATRIPDGATHV
ncbi:MAG: nucleotidyl transferase AbiEii/AbiGii toxin family protein [Gemmatimonadota bacterium]|nr:nucleotidyl transferase AbiEii/AbiGii toxin family protein [Gemmatimonadota bacterium]